MSNQGMQPQYIEDDEITLKELILKLKEFWLEIWKNWLLVGLIALPFVLYFFYNAWTTDTEYKAPITFMINEEDGGGGGGLSSLAGQFGFNVGGGGGEFNKDKIVALAKSEKIVYQTILDSVSIEGKIDILGNHIIDIFEIRDKWQDSKNEELHTFSFSRTDMSKFTRTENIALKSCYGKIVGSKTIIPLMSCSYDEDTGILNMSVQSKSEELSYELTEKLYEKLSSFYILQQTEPQQRSLEVIKHKTDSLKTLVESKEYALANLKDSRKNLVLQKFQIQEKRLAREIPAYYAQYAQTLQNLENADFLLNNATPFFQVIDSPIYPLSKVVESKIKAILIGGILGVFLAVGFIIMRKIIRDTMAED